MSFPITDGEFVHKYVNVYQRVFDVEAYVRMASPKCQA